jgi:hypothetical protein
MSQRFICAHIETPEQVFTWLIANTGSVRPGTVYNKAISLMVFLSNGQIKYATAAAWCDVPDDMDQTKQLAIFDALGKVFKDIFKDKSPDAKMVQTVTVLGIKNL